MSSAPNGGGAAEERARRNLHWQREKKNAILKALSSDPVDLSTLRKASLTFGGLLNRDLRKRVWPKLMGINVFYICPYKGTPLSAHKERAQVLLDVNRCGKRLPQDLSAEDRQTLQGQLERVILRLLAENPHLHYYQGLHDIVLTFLLETEKEEVTYALMDVMVRHHIRDFLDADMHRTKVIISSISSLLALEDEELEHFITGSECAYYFSLSWLITWYSHVIQSANDIARLTDVFLASHPLFPVYIAATLILLRRSEVMELECEMSEVHGLLSRLKPDLKYEQVIMLALKLFEKYPPQTLARKCNKLNASSLIKSYPTFMKEVEFQRPDHILIHEPPPPPRRSRHRGVRAWLEQWASNRTVRTLFSVAAPVIIAFFVYMFINTRTLTSSQVPTSL